VGANTQGLDGLGARDPAGGAAAPGKADGAGIDSLDCALVILSCDAYRDLWEPCLTLYRRYWPDCPYPMFLVSETMPVEDARVRALAVGAGRSWSEVVRDALSSLPHRDVLLMLDDFLLTGPVSSLAIEARRRSHRALGGAYLRLAPLPGPSARVAADPTIGEHERGAPYRASLQAAFWDRRTLLDLLRPDESPWDFERDGSRRSSAVPAPFYATWSPTLRYVNAVVRGRWAPAGRRVCRREALATDGARPDVTLRWRLATPRRFAYLAARGPVVWRVRKALGLRPGPGSD
jgi:hypothetical protein